MTINIDFNDHLDVRDLGDIARNEYGILTDDESEVEDLEDARETLDALKAMLTDLGMRGISDAEVSEHLHGISRTTNPTMYASGFFVEAMKEYVEDVGDMPSDMPSYIVIDWEATAAGLRAGYSAVYLDGNEYLIRR